VLASVYFGQICSKLITFFMIHVDSDEKSSDNELFRTSVVFI
jgi:hypothetical protein